jgi:hypothetical protein
MDIPDSISDMDSIPSRIALNRKHGLDSMLVNLQASVEDLCCRNLPRLAQGATDAAKHIQAFSAAVEVTELERMYGG